MPLNDLAIKRAEPSSKIVKLSDGGGLQRWITPDVAKRWRLAHPFGRVQKVLALDVYGSDGKKIGLSEAREARAAAAKGLRSGQDLPLR